MKARGYELFLANASVAMGFMKAHPGVTSISGYSRDSDALFFIVYKDSYSDRHEFKLPINSSPDVILESLRMALNTVEAGNANTQEPETQEEREPEPVIENPEHEVYIETLGVPCDETDGPTEWEAW
jgi:hypothetical protein